MKQTLLLLLSICLLSCSKDCDEEREALERQYHQALQNAGGSEAAREEVKRQYEERLADLDC